MAEALADNEDAEVIPGADDANDRIRDAVSQAWVRVLGQPSYESGAPWFQTGGDSLKKLRLWLDIEKGLGVRLPLEAFDDSATFADIVASVERALAGVAQSTHDEGSSDRDQRIS
jgi:hypothetical protein